MGKRYAVRVKLTNSKEINVWASSESAAMNKAEEICSEWNGVEEVHAVYAEEIDGD